MRGYVKDGFWYDKDDKPHSLSSMDDSYIENCAKLVSNRLERQAKNKDTDQQELITNVQSLAALVAEQEHRKNVTESNVGRLLYG